MRESVAVLSPSKHVPSLFPDVYELGLRNLSNKFGLKIKEYPTARAGIEFLSDNPRIRADDVNNEFEDEKVNAIIASIGGDESGRTLQSPKVENLHSKRNKVEKQDRASNSRA